ncbi:MULTISPECIES: hypothetical protein [unclassified Streptomyces]
MFEKAAREVDRSAFPDDRGAGAETGRSAREELTDRLLTAQAPAFVP